MRRIPPPSRPSPRLASSVAGIGLITWALAAQAQAPTTQATTQPSSAGAAAAAACERAARQAVNSEALHADAVTFSAAPTVQSNLSNESQLVLRGAGQRRGPSGVRNFNYSCNVDLNTFEAVGLVMRDATPAAAEAVPARALTEPDMSRLSPTACESSAAEALKQRWPRVSQISFDTATRRFRQQSASKAEFHGSGRAVPAPSSPSALFGFDCEIDPRDGRVLRTSISGVKSAV